MEMGERVTYDFLEGLSSIRDEDMLSKLEFTQIMKAYIVK